MYEYGWAPYGRVKNLHQCQNLILGISLIWEKKLRYEERENIPLLFSHVYMEKSPEYLLLWLLKPKNLTPNANHIDTDKEKTSVQQNKKRVQFLFPCLLL